MSGAQEFYAHSVAIVDADVRTSELVMGFEYGKERRKVIIRLPAGAAGGLFLGLRDKLTRLARHNAQRAAVIQPLVIRSISPFLLLSGKVGVAIEIEDFEIPLLMPPEIIAAIRISLDEVEAIAKIPHSHPRKN